MGAHDPALHQFGVQVLAGVTEVQRENARAAFWLARCDDANPGQIAQALAQPLQFLSQCLSMASKPIS